MIVGNGFNHVGQSIWHDATALDLIEPLAGAIWIGPFLYKFLFARTVFQNKRTVGVLILDAFGGENDIPVLVVIRKFGGNNFTRLAGGILAVRFLRRRPRQHFNGGSKCQAIEMPDQRNDVAAFGAASTVPDRLVRVDGKSIVAAT